MYCRSNFPMLHRGLCGALLSAINQRLAKDGTNLTQLKLWEDSCDMLNDLLKIIEKIDIKQNYGHFLRVSIMIYNFQ